MLILLIASAMIANAPAEDPDARLCSRALERKAGGEIATITVSSSRSGRSGRTIEGQLTAFVGMGAPAPGYAGTHHLIRSDFTFRCRIKRGRVREAAVNPLTG